MGKEGINLALKVINGEKVEPKTLIPGELITKDNVDQVPEVSDDGSTVDCKSPALRACDRWKPN